jgi:hypothetical protein
MTTALTPTGGTGVNTLLVLLNRVHDELGIERYSDISDPDHQALTTINALNDGVEDLWYKQTWPWQIMPYYQTLEVGVTSYPLPTRFMKLVSDMRIGANTLEELTPLAWNKLIPSDVTNPLPENGSTRFACIDGTAMIVWPPPSQDFIDNGGSRVYLRYRLKPPVRLNGDDNQDDPFDLPEEYAEAIVEFAKWKTGTKMGFPDVGAYRNRYDEIITNRIRSMKKLTRLAERQSYMIEGGHQDWW